MAYRPCLTCGLHFFGPAAYTYITWFDGEDRLAFRQSNCPSCAAQLRNQTLEQADARTDEDWTAAPGAPAIQPMPPRLEESRPGPDSRKSLNKKAAVGQ